MKKNKDLTPEEMAKILKRNVEPKKNKKGTDEHIPFEMEKFNELIKKGLNFNPVEKKKKK